MFKYDWSLPVGGGIYIECASFTGKMKKKIV